MQVFQAQVLVLSLESLQKPIKEQVINEKIKLAELEALASFRKQQKTKKLAVEEMKLEEELVKAKARVKVVEAQEKLENGKTLIRFRFKLWQSNWVH